MIDEKSFYCDIGRSLMKCAALALSLLGLLTAPALADRHALIVGVQDYQYLSSVGTARADSIDVADRLTAGGYDVIVLHDPSELEFLDVFFGMLADIEPDDDLFLYLSGQGFHHAGRDHVIFADEPTITGGDAARLSEAGLTIDWLRTRMMDGTSERVSVIVLDACRDFLSTEDSRFGRAARVFDRSRQRASRHHSAKSIVTAEPSPEGMNRSGSYVVYSTSVGSCALDGLATEETSRNSVFAGVFVEQMRNLGRSIQDIVSGTRQEVLWVSSSAGYVQRVEVHDSLDQPYVIIPGR